MLAVSEWADAHRMVGSYSAEPGPWRTSRTPYLREIMDSFTDPTVNLVVFQKCARIGGTEAGLNVIGYFIHQDPSPIMIVQPRVDDAKDFSKEQLAPMLADTACLAKVVSDPKSRDSGNTVLAKVFQGGMLFLVGANSPAGFRRRTVRILDLEEVDGYGLEVGDEGDPLKLAIRRTQTFGPRRKIFMNSTPTLKGFSRIEDYYQRSDQRHYLLPCPHCGHFQALRWDNLKYRDMSVPAYACEGCGVLIAEEHKLGMLHRGRWEPTYPGRPSRGYHINALYSPWVTWAELVDEWLEAQGDVGKLQTFVNTALGETWEERGGGLDAGALEQRAESYAAEIPVGVGMLTAGVDVQDDRLEVVVRGWGAGEESWLIERRIILGDPEQPDVWRELDTLLLRDMRTSGGGGMRVLATCVDSGAHTDAVYRYTEPRFRRRIYATKGSSQSVPYLVSPRPAQNTKGRARVFMTGPDVGKDTLYGYLRVQSPGPRYWHFPSDPDRYGGDKADYFRQLTSERKVPYTAGGRKVLRWELPRGERNEVLDCEVLNLAAFRLAKIGADRLERLAEQAAIPSDAPPPPPPPPEPLVPSAPNMGVALAMQRAAQRVRGRFRR